MNNAEVVPYNLSNEHTNRTLVSRRDILKWYAHVLRTSANIDTFMFIAMPDIELRTPLQLNGVTNTRKRILDVDTACFWAVAQGIRI